MGLLRRLFILLVILYTIFIFILYTNLQIIYDRLPGLISGERVLVKDTVENLRLFEDPKYRLHHLQNKRLNYKSYYQSKYGPLIFGGDSASNKMAHPFDENCVGNMEDINLVKKAAYYVVDYSIFIYSAFLDNRTGVPTVRMMSMVRRPELDPLRSLWCHFRVPGDKDGVYKSSKAEFYEMCENHKMLYGGWIISCRLPDFYSNAPCHVTVSSVETHAVHMSAIYIPLMSIHYNYSTTPKRTFGVCVPPLHSNISVSRFVEFIELNTILGAQYFTFYVYEMPDGLIPVINYYVQRGVVSVIGWQLPFTFHQHIWYYGQSVAINDCLYRNMPYFQYVAIIDLDEYIVPQGELKTWNDIVRAMNDSTSGLSFVTSIFTPKTTNESEGTSILKPSLVSDILLQTLTWLFRTDGFSYVRNKVMVESFAVFELGIHHVSKWWTDDKGYHVTEVTPNIAFIHHYKRCQKLTDLHCDSFVKDSTVLDKYGDSLVLRYNNVEEELNS